MLKRLTSVLLVFSMLLSLLTTAFAVSKPSIPQNGATIYVDDVRVEENATNVTAKLYINYADSFTTINSSAIKLTVPADTTGISTDSPAQLGKYTGTTFVRPAANTKYGDFLKTGSGRISLLGDTVNNIHEMTLEFTVPKVMATSKITVEPYTGEFKANDTPTTIIADSAIAVATGSFIVQYPVKVEIAADSGSPANFAISTTTTKYNDKATYDMAGADTTTLTTGGTFYVDSGEGQQNRPVLNFTVPENYYAEVTVNGVKHTVGSSEFTLPEAITKDTTVSVKVIAGQKPSDEFTNTSMSYRYGNYDLAAQDTKRFDKKGTDNTVAIKNFDGYKLVKYQINNDAAVTENLGTPVTVDITKDNSIVFTYERQDNSTVVPGPNGTIGGGDDVTITPVDKDLPAIVPDDTGAVTLPADKQGVVSDDKGNTVVVPGGTKVDKEGKIYLPGVTEPVTPENPKPEGNAFYLVTYKYENTVLFTQLGKTDETVQAMDYPSSAKKPEGKEFKNWNTQNAGNGQTYEKEANINGELTLYAQWKDATVDPGALNSAKITYYSNESTSAPTKEEVRRDKVDTPFPGALDVNAFAAPGEGWTLAGWLRKDNGSNTIYGANQNVILNKDEAWTLYAQWVKNSDDGSITVPGKDSIPGSPDDATAKPGNQGGTLRRDDTTGIITIPAGGSVTVEGKEYPMPDGGTLKPNGEISIDQPNGGSIVVKPDGGTEVVKPDGDKDPSKTAFMVTYESGEAGQPAKVVTAVDSVQIADGEAMFPNFKDHKFAYWKSGDEIKSVGDTLAAETTLTAYWYTVDENGGVVIKPDPDKEPDKEIVVKPDPDGNKPEPGKDGSVDVKPGGSIEVKPKEPNGGVIELPDGGKVNPDGTITIPGVEGKIDPNKPDTWPVGIHMVKYNANGGTGEMASQLGKEPITVKRNTFTRDSFQFNIWNTEANGSGTSYKESATIEYTKKGQVITLYALWYKQNTDGSIVHPGGDGKFQPEGEKDDITVKPAPGGSVEKPDDNGNIKVPGGGSIVVPGKDGETTEIVPPTGTVITPDGKIETPDPDPTKPGGSVTIDPSKPNGGNENFLTIKFAPGTHGFGSMAACLVNKNQNFTLPANKFTSNGKFVFTGWNTQENGAGTPYGETITAEQLKAVTVETLTLVAQWKASEATAKSATITFKWNDAKDSTNQSTQTVKWNDGDTSSAQLTPDVAPSLEGWKQTSWNTEPNGTGTSYALNETVTVENGKPLTLYALWVQEKADGSVVNPGKDGFPGGGDDITVKPGPDKKPGTINPDGSITVPDGGSVKKEPDNTEIVMPDGGKVNPDGTIEIPVKNPAGTIVIKPDGSTEVQKPGGTPDTAAEVIIIKYEAGNDTAEVVEYKTVKGAKDVAAITNPFKWLKHVFSRWQDKDDTTKNYVPSSILPTDKALTLVALWFEQGEDGSIVIPVDPGTKDDDVTVKPNPTDPEKKPSVDENGSVKVPEGGEVVTPNGSVTLPEGGKVEPDGTVKDDKGNTIDPENPNQLPDGFYQVIYYANDGSNKTEKRTGKSLQALAADTFTNGANAFVTWNAQADGQGTSYAPGKEIPAPATGKTVKLYAIWYQKNGDGDIVVKPDPDGDKEIVVKPNPDGSKPTPGEDGSVEVKPGGSIEVKPKDPNGGVIELPDGGKVNPDGTITIPGVDGKIDPNAPETWPEGILMVKYNANGGTGEMASQLGKNSITVKKNTFTQNDGFQFNIWNTEANGSGTSYQEGDSVAYAKKGQVTTLYAMWYKQNADGSVVHPGPDGKPGGGDDITIKPNPNPGDPAKKPEVQPDGSVKVPDGGEIVIPGANTPTDDKTVTVTPGATVKPDGSIVIPEGGSATIQPEGTTVTGPTTLKPDALPKPPAANPDPSKPYKPGNGTIVLPGADGSTEAPKDKDNVIVKPDTGTIDPGNNNVTTKGDNTTIEYPKAPNGNGAIIKVPEGTVIKPDGSIDMLPEPGGTIVLPDGTEITVPGGSKVDPDGTITIPDGGKGEITPPGGDKTEIPGGSTIDKDGNIVLPDGGVMSPDGKYKYTVVLKSSNGTALTVNGYESIHWVKKDTQKTVVAPAVTGYLITGESSVVVTGGQKVNGGYTITFTYTQNSGGTIIVTPSNPSKPSNPNKPSDPSDTNRPASPSVTGVSKMLESENHIAYMGGYGNGMFGPNDQMTRAQVAQMFYNLLKDKNIAITVNFSDVQGSDWYATAVNTLASLGIIRGVGDGIFDPNRSITRAEFATIALRFADKTAGGTNPFTDVASNDWYYSAVLNAVGFGWITGYSDGTFRPNASITRAEVATIVNRMLDRNADHDFVNGNATASFVDVPSNHWAYYNIMEATTPHTHTVDRNGNESWGKLQ